MTTWSEEEIRKLAKTDDLHIAPFRSDGTTYGTPTWIWSVVVDNDLYVRAYNGKASHLVPGSSAAEGGTHHRGRHDEEGDV